MTIKELKKYIDQAYGKHGENGDCEVEFWLELEDEEIICELSSIGQFGIIKDMTMSIKPDSTKIYSSKKLSSKQLNYKKRYESLLKSIDKIRRIACVAEMGGDADA